MRNYFWYIDKKRNIESWRKWRRNYCDHCLQKTFANSARFMSSCLSCLVDDLAEVLHKTQYKDCKCCLESETVKDKALEFNCPNLISFTIKSLRKIC